MALELEEAAYQLSYESDGEQPVIAVHAHPSYFRYCQLGPNIEAQQAHFHLESFTSDADAYGYGGVGHMVESPLVDDWTALRMPLPEGEEGKIYLGSPTKKLLPIVTTFSSVLGHLNHGPYSPPGYPTDPNRPQFLTASAYNSVGRLNQPDSAYLRARLTPALLTALSEIEDIKTIEARVREALKASFAYPYPPAEDWDDSFGVTLGPEISFDYPGDGTGFFGRQTDETAREGLTINAKNNDYPVQQIALLGGLAALNDAALEAWGD